MSDFSLPVRLRLRIVSSFGVVADAASFRTTCRRHRAAFDAFAADLLQRRSVFKASDRGSGDSFPTYGIGLFEEGQEDGGCNQPALGDVGGCNHYVPLAPRWSTHARLGPGPSACVAGWHSSLTHAVDDDHAGCVRSMVVCGADPNERNPVSGWNLGSGEAAIHQAARESRPECLVALVELGADINQGTGGSGWTALHIAAIDGVRILLAAGADASRLSKDGKSPAQVAWATPLIQELLNEASRSF